MVSTSQEAISLRVFCQALRQQAASASSNVDNSRLNRRVNGLPVDEDYSSDSSSEVFWRTTLRNVVSGSEKWVYGAPSA